MGASSRTPCPCLIPHNNTNNNNNNNIFSSSTSSHHTMSTTSTNNNNNNTNCNDDFDIFGPAVTEDQDAITLKAKVDELVGRLRILGNHPPTNRDHTVVNKEEWCARWEGLYVSVFLPFCTH
jgi:hypothetical protein